MVLFVCVTHPPQFSHIGSFEYHKDVCVEHVMQQIEVAAASVSYKYDMHDEKHAVNRLSKV